MAGSAVPSEYGKKTPKAKRTRSIYSIPFAVWYKWIAAGLLFGSTIWWALLSAHLQNSNADQLVYPYLFQTSAGLHHASLPSAHTFLVKWPIFFLVDLIGLTRNTLLWATVGVTVITVAGLAWLVSRIERRAVVIGTLWLAMAAMLMVVPATPYAGALLPTNMAMLATRNLEYLLYIASLVLIARGQSFRQWWFWAGTVLLALLMASDHLFLALSIGGALLALVVYALARNWKLVSLAVRWLVAGLIAAILSVVVIALINVSGLTHISSQSGTSPYAVVSGPKAASLAVLYGILGLLTNFGSNPAFDGTVVRDIPHQISSRLFGVGGIAFVVCFVLLLVGLYVSWRVLQPGLLGRSKNANPDKALQLSLLLLWSTVAAAVFFVASNHYYAVDSRYLTVGFFAVFVAAARYLRRRTLAVKKVAAVGLVAFLALLSGSWFMLHNYHAEQQALAPVADRNATIAQVLQNHNVSTLLGDYWRVTPTKLAAKNHLNITPLSGCTQPSQILSSTAWQPDLRTHSFAYLLSTRRGLTDYPACSLQQIVNNYGRPNASQLIAGNLSNPAELLLFYDRGIHKSSPTARTAAQSQSTVLPIGLDDLPYTSCPQLTVMNVVAHQDDDILFMNPDLIHSIKAGDCIRSVYVTAGDDGGGQFYWLSREQAAEAAYSEMLGSKAIWVKRIVKLANNEYITVANPRGNAKISLIFLNVPDGNLKGEGFITTRNESLAKLAAGQIHALHTVDGQSTFTASQLTTALTALMFTYQPGEIRTQATVVSEQYPDHSDHMAVSRFTQKAAVEYEKQQFNDQVSIPLHRYIGYPIHAMSVNVSGKDLAEKEAAFMAYAKYDHSVCQTAQQCLHDPAYGAYLPRQYQQK